MLVCLHFFSQKFTFFSEEDDGDITPTPSSASESIAEKTADNDVVVPNGYSHHEKEYDEPSNIEVVEEKPQPPLRVESHTTNNNRELKVQTEKKCSDDDSDTEEVGSDTETIDVSIDLDVHSVGNDIAPQNVSICLLHLYTNV